MDAASIELLIRRASDASSLRAVESALRALGESCRLARVADVTTPELSRLPVGPASCALRVVIEGEDTAPAIPGQDAETVVLWEDCSPPRRAFAVHTRLEQLARARCIAVPGRAHARFLSLHIPSQVSVCGIARLDPVVLDAGTARQAARRALGSADDRKLVVYAPSPRRGRSAVEFVGERVVELCGPGRTVAIVAFGWPADWLEWHRRLASSRADLLLLEREVGSELLAAADVVVGDESALLWEAHALGCPVIGLDRSAAPEARFDASAHSVERLLQELTRLLARGGARSVREEARELLEASGDAARRIAQLVRGALRFDRPGESDARAPAVTLATLEARAAFGELDAVCAELAARIAQDPSAEGFVLMSSLERRRGQHDAAEQAAQRATELGRATSARGLCELARIAVERSEHERARERFQEAHSLAPQLADPLVGLGSLALHDGDATRAEAHFRAALELEKSGRTWSGLGLSLAAQSRNRDALPALEAALDLDPDCQPALYGLVQAGFQLGELRLAAERLTRFVEAHPANLDFIFTLAGLRCELGHTAAALELVDRIAMFNAVYPGLSELRAKLERQAT
jgi:tetratricopeptide (TPR) repeat protein